MLYRSASFTRKFLNLKDEPVKDIFTLLEKNGIIIYELDTDLEQFDGASFINDSGQNVIIVNKNFSNDRKRFTIAHELGHIIMHLSTSFLIPDFRNKEKEADIFASEFLMPKDSIRNMLMNLKLSDLFPIKQYWLTSMASIIYRAKDLNCISSDKYKYFYIELSRKGYKKEEPGNVYIDQPIVYNKAIQMHKNELEYSDIDISKAFSLPLDVVKNYMSLDRKSVV